MSSRFPEACLLAACMLLPGLAGAAELRVCADPDNLPYSDAAGRGFENRIASLVAEEMGAELRYEWLPLRRGFVRKTLGSGSCDVFIGVPTGFERVLTTRPYYRSAYVMVHRAAEPAPGFDDPRLRSLRLGVQLIGNDLAATPPGLALAERGIAANVRGFTIYGDGPAVERMVDALARGEVDAILAWGPQAGYFARRATPPLALDVLQAPAGMPGVPFQFSISMGVRRGDRELRDKLDAVIENRRADIEAILDAYGVPRVGANKS